MRNETMQQLDTLRGTWRTTLSNAWFLEPTDQEVPGSATGSWLDDAFLVFRWTLSREDPDMHQRFIADLRPDRIDGRWEASDDGGTTWRKDFDLIFERVGVGERPR